MLNGCPSEAGKDRDDFLFEEIKSGKADFSYSTITSSFSDHKAEFYVFSDALKIDSVRINVSAELQQKIADSLDCMLLTARLADMIWIQKDCTIKPLPRLISSSTVSMIAHSQSIDNELAKFGTEPKLISTVGKHWIVDNDLAWHIGRAINYGWHFANNDFVGPTEYSVSKDEAGKQIKMIQGRGWGHDIHHVDYSQTCVLVSNQCKLDGNLIDLKTLLGNNVSCNLASHQGPLKIFRQSGTQIFPKLNAYKDKISQCSPDV